MIHKAEELKNWVSIESAALKPILFTGRTGQKVCTLLATKRNDNMYKVWAYVCWSLPDGKIEKYGDIRNLFKEQESIVTKDDLYTIQSTAVMDKIANESKALKSVIYGEGLSQTAKDLYDLLLNSSIFDFSPNLDSEQKTNECVDFAKTMSEIKDLIKEIGEPALKTEWSSTLRSFAERRFTVAVVGEFNRGKTTLVNKLLGNDILPTGILPTTNVLTQIAYGPSNKAIIVKPGGVINTVSLDKEQLLKIMENFAEEDSKQGFIQVQINNDELKTSDINIIDTPGVNDEDITRTSISYETISRCDATIVVLSAITPMSLTEKNFIKEHLLLKKVPNIAVVLTHLDQVQVNDRSNILDYLCRKVNVWGKNMPIFISEYLPGVSDNQLYQVGVEAIWSQLESWSCDTDLKKKRYLYSLSQLQWLIDLVRTYINAKKNQAQNNTNGNKTDTEKGKSILRKQELAWEDLCLQVDERKQSRIKHLIDEINDHKQKFITHCISEISKQNEPKKWLDNAFEKTLKNYSEGMLKATNDKITKICFQDANDIYETATRIFEEKTNTIIKPNIGSINAQEEFDFSCMGYINNGLLGRPGGYFVKAGIVGIGYVFAPVIAPFLPIAGMAYILTTAVASDLAGRGLSKLRAEKKTEQLLIAEQIINNICDKYFGDITNALTIDVNKWYKNCFNEIESRKKRWISVQELAATRHESAPNYEIQNVDKWERKLNQIINQF